MKVSSPASLQDLELDVHDKLRVVMAEYFKELDNPKPTPLLRKLLWDRICELILL